MLKGNNFYQSRVFRWVSALAVALIILTWSWGMLRPGLGSPEAVAAAIKIELALAFVYFLIFVGVNQLLAYLTADEEDK